MLVRVASALVLAALVYAGLGAYGDLGAMGGELRAIGAAPVAAALALALGNYALRYLKWALYVRRLGLVVARRDDVLVFLSGFALSITPGKVGELIKAVLLRALVGAPVARTAPIVVAERATDLLALCALAAAGAATYRRGAAAVAGAAALVGALLALAASERLGLGALRVAARVPGARRLVGRAEELVRSTRALCAPAPLAAATALSLAAWWLECLGFSCIVGAGASLGLATFIYAATTIAGALSFLPGGLGVTEASMAALLVAVGHGVLPARAAAATLAARLCTLWFAVALGACAWALLARRLRATTPRAARPAGP